MACAYLSIIFPYVFFVCLILWFCILFFIIKKVEYQFCDDFHRRRSPTNDDSATYDSLDQRSVFRYDLCILQRAPERKNCSFTIQNILYDHNNDRGKICIGSRVWKAPSVWQWRRNGPAEKGALFFYVFLSFLSPRIIRSSWASLFQPIPWNLSRRIWMVLERANHSRAFV